MHDLTIIGNGIIGYFVAYNYLNLEPKAKINLIGPSTKLNSATIASGAMINVLPEIDTLANGKDYYEQKIRIGEQSTKIWNNLFKKGVLDKNIKIADNTILYRQKNGPKYEKNAYELTKINCKKNKKFSNKKYKLFGNNKEYFTIKNEIAVDSNLLIKFFEKKIIKKINYIDSFAKSIITSNSKKAQQVITSEGKIISSKKILICCGYNSGKLMNSINKNSIKILSSIGDAFQIENAENFLSGMPKRSVIRTTNRGSSCGIHVVPLNSKKFYLGSTSNLTFSPENEKPKFGSIEYILSTFKNEIYENTNSFQINHVRGFRPVSIDGKPAIGELNKNIFVITGTFRDGLTNVPYYSKIFLEWLFRNNQYFSLIKDWSPLRKPISYGTQSESIKEYVDTKLCGLIEHRSIKNKKKSLVENELYQEAKKIYKKLILSKQIDKNFSIHPLILNLYK
tara:strand:- start:1943 stop:3298 length:1356 start_codon:yes stop_codon:yes gene_type:complete